METDQKEIKKFFGLMLRMELMRLNSIEKYWSKNTLFRQDVPRAIMSRNRFHLLLSVLDFSNNETAESGNRLAKIQPLVDMLKINFQNLFCPEENIVIDETSVLLLCFLFSTVSLLLRHKRSHLHVLIPAFFTCW